MKTFFDGLDANNELNPFFFALKQMRSVQNSIDKVFNEQGELDEDHRIDEEIEEEENGIDFDRVDTDTKAEEEKDAVDNEQHE